MKRISEIAMLVLICISCRTTGYGQSPLSKIKNGVKQTTENSINRTIDKGFEKWNEASVPQAKPDAGQASSPAQQAEPAEAPKKKGNIDVFSKYTFSPGEKIIYEEHFTDAVVGELPSGWNTNAGGHAVRTEDKTTWLNVINGVYLAAADKEKFGQDYTIEFDLILNVSPKTGYYLPYFYFGGYAGGEDEPGHNKFLQGYRLNNAFEIKLEPCTSLKSKVTLRSFAGKEETLNSGRIENTAIGEKLKQKIHIAIAVQKSRLQLWMDEDKFLDLPKAVNSYGAPINQLFFKTENSGGYDESIFSYLISNIKIAVGLPDARSSLAGSGKFSSSGIVFDVNSDKLKPQSGGILRNIADILGEHPTWNMRITGHTDSDGPAAANKELSHKRAEAVKTVLVKTFEIDAARIETGGKGASEPLADNRTREGRAANRRVEFQKT